MRTLFSILLVLSLFTSCSKKTTPSKTFDKTEIRLMTEESRAMGF
jgi:hypothetical protein